MRTAFASILILLTCSIAAQQSVTPDELLQRGKDNFRSGHFDEAVNDLKSAADTYLSPEQKANYINTGHLATLPKLEEAFVYLAISYARLGQDEQVRDTIARLLTAERIEPTYAKLTLDPDAAEFEQVAAKFAPRMPLPPRTQVAEATPPTPLPVVVPATPAPTVTAVATPAPAVAEATPAPAVTAPTPAPPAPTPAVTAPTPAPAVAAAAPATETPIPVQPTLAQERAEVLQLIEQRVAEARAQIEKDAEQRIAQERAAAQKAADQRIAQERAAAEQRIAQERDAAQKAADERVAQERQAAQTAAEQRIAEDRAAAQKAADERVAEERAAAQKAADERIAQERAAAQKAADERIAQERAAAEQRVAAERAAAERAAQERIAAAEAEQRKAILVGLRQAESFAASNAIDRANAIYNSIAASPNTPREAIAAAAAGLYRTGDFPGAVRAFRRLGTFAKGEEDLRYYNAVSLYETGNYDEAKKELSCALPFIQVTNDVARYRAKIENTPSQQAMK